MRMARPRIVSETKREIEERKPPGSRAVRPHEWLSAESASLYKERVRSSSPFTMYLSTLAESKIRKHAIEEAPRGLEVMGFLLGDVQSWRGVVYSAVRDAVTTELRSTPAKVRFNPEAFPDLFIQLDDSGFDYILVGWYHSHPGHTCFMSLTDIATQRSMFNQPYHSALVVDPLNHDIKAFRLAGGGVEEIPFALFEPPDAAPRARKGRRTRRLKVSPVVSTSDIG
jgi:proteasome lid subunit RPN8/RPN11